MEVINDGELKWEKVELSKWVPPAGCARWDIAEGKEGHVGRDGKPNNVGARRYVHTPGTMFKAFFPPALVTGIAEASTEYKRTVTKTPTAKAYTNDDS